MENISNINDINHQRNKRQLYDNTYVTVPALPSKNYFHDYFHDYNPKSAPVPGLVNEKPFATTLFTQLHCEGLFNIKGEYENLIERKGDGGKSIAVFRLH